MSVAAVAPVVRRPAAENRVTAGFLGIYIHIPFCRHRCPYCDFATAVGALDQAEQYTRLLLTELAEVEYKHRLSGRMVVSIYLGGGTPSLLSPELVDSLITGCYNRFTVADDVEITLEANPCSVTEWRLRAYRSVGVNRLSLGLQSFHDVHLRRLGRLHSGAEGEEAIRMARRAGFDNLNLDLMYAIPGQTLSEWISDLHRTAGWEPEHVSAYSLIFEPGTVFHRWRESGRLTPVDEDLEADMFRAAMDILPGAGLSQYEISNFARPGRESRHNCLYWRDQDYIGIGVGAHSSMRGRRWWNMDSLPDYRRAVQTRGSGLAGTERLNRRRRIGESLMLQLRLTAGISRSEFRLRHGVDPFSLFEPSIRRMMRDGLMEQQGDRLRLTRRGIMLANQVFMEFVDTE